MLPGSYKTCNMSNIHHQISACFIGDLTESLEIDGAGIRTGTCDDQLRMILEGKSSDLVIIDKAIVIYSIGDHMKIFPGHVCGASMGEMSAVIEVHAHHSVSGLQHGEENRHIGLCSGMGLYICIFTAEKLLGAFDG